MAGSSALTCCAHASSDGGTDRTIDNGLEIQTYSYGEKNEMKGASIDWPVEGDSTLVSGIRSFILSNLSSHDGWQTWAGELTFNSGATPEKILESLRAHSTRGARLQVQNEGWGPGNADGDYHRITLSPVADEYVIVSYQGHSGPYEYFWDESVVLNNQGLPIDMKALLPQISKLKPLLWRKACGEEDSYYRDLGFWDSFEYPQNISITKEGFLFKWSSEEVSGGSEGNTEALVTFDEMRPFASEALSNFIKMYTQSTKGHKGTEIETRQTEHPSQIAPESRSKDELKVPEGNVQPAKKAQKLSDVGLTDDYSDIVCYVKLNPSDIDHLTKAQLRILRNTIYARHGRKFKSKDLRDYFNRFNWYNPRYDEISPNELSAVEKHNITLIQKYE